MQRLAVIILCVTALAADAGAQSFESDPAWPLCGRITESPPANGSDADGEVMIAGPHSGYSDPLAQIRRFRPGETSCATRGCYTTNAMHLNGWTVAAGDLVAKGDRIANDGGGKGKPKAMSDRGAFSTAGRRV